MKSSSRPNPTALDLPCLCALLRKAGRVVTRRFDGYFKESGLRITQYSMLVNIRLNPEVTVSHLANLLLMDQTTVTRNLKVLEKLQYVRVEPDPGDHRIRKVTITHSGNTILRKTRSSWEAAQEEMVNTLGTDRVQTLVGALQRLIASGTK